MSFNPKSIIVAAGIVALSLSAVGCNGQVPGTTGYVPSSVASAVSADGFQKKDIDIKSNCGHTLHLVIAGLVDCKFREKGYGSGTFTVANDTNGIVLVTPSSGTEATTFTIVGLVLGGGKLVWSDSHSRKFTVKVKVTL